MKLVRVKLQASGKYEFLDNCCRFLLAFFRDNFGRAITLSTSECLPPEIIYGKRIISFIEL